MQSRAPWSVKHQQNGKIKDLLMFSLANKNKSLRKTSANRQNQRFADVFSGK